MGPDVHAGRIEPHEERLRVADCASMNSVRGLEKLLVDRLHALLGEWPGVLAFLLAPGAETGSSPGVSVAVGDALEDATRAELRLEIRTLRIVRIFRLLLGIQMIEVAEEHVEAVHGGQEFVAITEMILAELPGRVALRLQQFSDGRIFFRQAFLRRRQADLQQPRRAGTLSGDERRAPGGAGLLPIIVCEDRALRWRCGRCWACGSPSCRDCRR